jgi:hypothetical protein
MCVRWTEHLLLEPGPEQVAHGIFLLRVEYVGKFVSFSLFLSVLDITNPFPSLFLVFPLSFSFLLCLAFKI